MKNIIRKIILIVTFILLITGCSNDIKEKKIILNLSVASSLKDAMIDIKQNYEAINKNVELVINYGSSGSLKHQIQNGAPCDIFISAGKIQIDELEKEGVLISETIKPLVKNKLVLIGPKNSELKNINELNSDKVNYIGVGDPNSVPAGKYADEVLINLDIKNKLEEKLVFAKDVKEVLAWVESENADAGFVYFSDTINNNKITIIEKIDESKHSEIVYPVSIIKNSKNIDQAKKFEEYILSNEGKMIFTQYGYR